MPSGRVTGRQILYPSDDGGVEELQGETVGEFQLPSVREGLGEGVTI